MPAFSRAVAQSRCRLVTRAAESRSCGSSRATAHGAARARRGVAALGGGVLRDWLCRLPQAQRDDAPLRYQPRRSPGPGVAPMAGGRRRGGPRAASSAAAPSPTAPRRPPRGPGPGGRGPGPPGCRAVTCFGPGSRRIIARPRGRRRGGASAGSVDAAAVAACWQARVVRRPWHGRPGPGTQRVSLPLPTSQSESPRRRVDPSRSKSDPADRRTAVRLSESQHPSANPRRRGRLLAEPRGRRRRQWWRRRWRQRRRRRRVVAGRACPPPPPRCRRRRTVGPLVQQ